MRKVILLIILLVTINYFSFSQNLSPSVIASTGNFSSNPSLSLTSTTGELIIKTFTQFGNTLTQGFNQPENIAVFIDKEDKLIGDTYLFPNPVIDNMTIEIRADKRKDYNIKVFDILGRNIQVPYEKNESGYIYRITLNMQDLSAGVYLIANTSTDNKTVSTFKLNKLGH